MSSYANKQRLRIFHWNINSFQRRKQELLQYIARKQPDIICLNEIRTPGEYIHVNNYDVHFKNRVNSDYGGVAIIINKNIQHVPVPIAPTFEAVAVKIDNKITVVAAYCHPNSRIQTSDIDMLLGQSEQVIIAGDLNARHPNWDATTPNANGDTLDEHSAIADYAIETPDEPTFPRTGSTIDIVLVKNCVISTPRIEEDL